MGFFFMVSYFVLVLGLPFSMHFIWFLPLSLCAAVTIVVKKRLVNSITFFYYFKGSGIVAVAAWRRGCINSSMGLVTSSMAEVEFWLKCVFRYCSGVMPTAIADAVRGVAGQGILHRHCGRGGRWGMGRRMITSLEIARVCFEVQQYCGSGRSDYWLSFWFVGGGKVVFNFF